LMGLLIQGDLYFFFTFGLLLAVYAAGLFVANRWEIPSGFLTGLCAGILLFASFFLFQRFAEHPDLPRRIGVAEYPRSSLLFLPGYAPLLRIGIVFCLAGVVLLRIRRTSPAESAAGSGGAPAERVIAMFFVTLLSVAWFAQPIQVFALGQAAQIYHYLCNVVPILFGYAVIVLGYHALKPAFPLPEAVLLRSRGLGALVLAGVLVLETALAAEQPLERCRHLGTPRGAAAAYEPWAAFGDHYRPNLRALEHEFIANPVLQQARTFSTFNFDVSVLLTAFYDQRAYNPDPGASTLADDVIEDRLCEMGKVLGIPPEQFGSFVRQLHINNYYLACNKYRFATDYRFSGDEDYPSAYMAVLQRWHPQWGWVLFMPDSEVRRLVANYASVLARESDPQTLPDIIVLSRIEWNMGMTPAPEWYGAIYSNQIFQVYVKANLLPFAAAQVPAGTGTGGGSGPAGETGGRYQTTLDLVLSSADTADKPGDMLLPLDSLEEPILRSHEAALRLQPASAELHFQAGNTLALLGETDAALKHYQRAVQLDPAHAGAQNNLGLLLAKRGRLSEATACFEAAVKADPDLAQARYILGVAMMNEHRLDEATAHFEAILRIEPEHARAHYQLAMSLSRQHRAAEAVTHLQAAVRLKPDWVEAVNNLAWLLATHPDDRIRDRAAALRLASHAAEVTHGKDVAVLDTLAAAFAETGRFDDAVRTSRRAIHLARAKGMEQSVKDLRTRMDRYQQRQPWREE
jgi:tetratricopeptide (TPR) repeat protein